VSFRILAKMMRPERGFLCVVLVIVFLSGCASSGGVYHTVGEGETLWRISHAYGVNIQDVAEINNIDDPAKVRAGQRIFIPGARKARKVTPYKPSRKLPSVKDGEEAGKEETKIVKEKGRFSWPVKGEMISPFGAREDGMHAGIDIKAREGTPVIASSDGDVAYSGGMAGYGNVIILKHPGNYFTVYAHNEKNLVKGRDNVKRGEEIALVGKSGNATTAHLHFEIRQGRKPRNPLFFLP